jgi:hypothetical protein
MCLLNLTWRLDLGRWTSWTVGIPSFCFCWSYSSNSTTLSKAQPNNLTLAVIMTKESRTRRTTRVWNDPSTQTSQPLTLTETLDTSNWHWTIDVYWAKTHQPVIASAILQLAALGYYLRCSRVAPADGARRRWDRWRTGVFGRTRRPEGDRGALTLRTEKREQGMERHRNFDEARLSEYKDFSQLEHNSSKRGEGESSR